ncbi:phosphatase PAP2 family protein [Bradyrhizobium sp. RDM4]|uniref:phosphatase PAP2 family protein n=1 Tax=Bradyrhizobium sp. RDM4 TaxID=3378765 RepID=UPI0038FC8D58
MECSVRRLLREQIVLSRRSGASSLTPNDGLRTGCYWSTGALWLDALALCIGLAITTFTLEGLMTREVLTAPALAVAGLWLMRWGWGERPAFTMLAFAQMGCFVMFAAPLSYIGLGAGMPLQDARFAELDRLLGLDWPAYFHFAMARPELLLYAKVFYAMILMPAFGVPVVLGLTGQYIRLQQFVMASTLALSVVIVVSSLLPAVGTYFEFGLPSDTELFHANGYGGQAREIPMLRDGTLRALNIAKLGGILTFPSFHAATALLSIWSLWSIWWLRPALLMLNAGMLLATPLVGGALLRGCDRGRIGGCADDPGVERPDRGLRRKSAGGLDAAEIGGTGLAGRACLCRHVCAAAPPQHVPGCDTPMNAGSWPSADTPAQSGGVGSREQIRHSRLRR